MDHPETETSRGVDFSEAVKFLGFLFEVSPCFHVFCFPRFTTDEAKQARKAAINQGRKEESRDVNKQAIKERGKEGRKEATEKASKQTGKEARRLRCKGILILPPLLPLHYHYYPHYFYFFFYLCYSYFCYYLY